MRRHILVVVVMIIAILVASSAMAYAKKSDNTTKNNTTAPDTTTSDQAGPITSENHSWGGYHWARTANPFTVKLGDNLSGTWKPYLQTTSSDWNQSSVLQTTVIAGQSSRNCKPKSGQDQVCNAAYGNNGWLGLASIWLSGSHITQGTTKVNDTYFNQTKYNNPNERNHVMCQEVGHTFGLDHQSTDGTSLNTCMDYFSNTGANAGSTQSTHPNQHDYDELATIYAHLDSINTIGASTPSKGSSANSNDPNRDEPGDGPPAWGKEVSRSADGRESVYELDLGNGDKKVTHVRWTEEQAAKNQGGKK